MIKSGFRKQKRYAVDAAGDKQLVSTWTSTDTVYDGEGTDMTTLLATKTVPQATVADNGKTLRVIDGAWALDTDNVLQTETTSSDSMYELLFSGTATNETLTENTRKHSELLYNPYYKALVIKNGLDPITEISPGQISMTNVSGTTPPKIILGGETVDLKIFDTDIQFTGSTWDGTNTSLKTAITNKLDKSGGTMTGNITMSGCQLTASQPNVSAHIKSDEVQVSDSSGGSVRVQSDNVRVLRQGVSLTMSNTDIVTSLGNTWDGTNTSLKTALAGKFSTSGGTITGDITMDTGQIYTTTLNFNHTGMNKGWGYLTLSDSQSQLYLQSPTNHHSIIIGAWAYDVDIINDTKWDGTHTSLKDALAAATNNDAVTQEDTSAGGLYRVLLSNTTNDTTYTGQVRKTSTLTYNPLTYDLTIGANSSTGGGTIKPNFNNTGTIGTEDNKFYSSYIQYMYGAGSTIKNGNTSYDYITEIGGASIWLKEVNKQTSTTTVGLTLSTGDAFLTGSTWDGTHTSLKDTISYIISRL